MKIPYRTRRTLQRVAVTLLTVLLVAALVYGLWFVWLQRFVVYTRDQGAILDMNRSEEFAPGEVAVPPEDDFTVSIYYNEGENAINTSKELKQLVGYYADTQALEEDVSAVLSQVKALPTGTPVMVDVKSPKGSFYYSSAVSTDRSSLIDTAVMDEIIAHLKKSNMYAIARLPALRDYAYGLNHVSDGLPTSGGYLWADDDYCYWLNPSSQGTITYLLQIVTELKNLGFDEVVFENFYFPETDKIVFNQDKTEALTAAAKTLVSTCATDTFALSFVGQTPAFPLPEGRSRLYLENVTAAELTGVAQQTGLEETETRLVFLTEVHDTRFDAYSVLRPLSAAH